MSLPTPSALFLFIAAVAVSTTAALHPVVLVPGLAGSVMKMKLNDGPAPHFSCSTNSDWFVAWVNVEELVPIQKDCLIERLRFTFDAATQTYTDAPGVTIDSNVDFGNLGGIAYLDPNLHESDYFHSLAQYLVDQLGYTAGTNLHGAPYDWRYAPDGHNMTGAFYDKLTSLIETTYTSNNNSAVHLISHSLGGPTLLAFLNHHTAAWKGKYIATFIPLAPPFAGSTEQILASISGDNFEIPLVPSDYFYPIQSAAPSGVFLWPVPAAFGNDPMVFTPSRNYSAAEIIDLNKAMNNTQAIDAYNNLRGRGWATADAQPPGVPTHIIYSHGVKTANKFFYDAELVPSFPHSSPTRKEYGDGDSAVNIESINYVIDAWRNIPDITFFNVSGVSHFGIMSDQTVFAHIKGLLTAYSR